MPMSIQCPHCGKPLNAPDELAGKSCKCPACGNTLTVPVQPQPVTPQTPSIEPSPAAQTETPAPSELATRLRTTASDEGRTCSPSRNKRLSPMLAWKAKSVLGQIHGLRETLTTAYSELGIELLEAENSPIASDHCQGLGEVLSKTEELRAKLSTVTAAKSTATLAKPIRAEIAELQCRRTELLATVGREAYETGHGSEALRSKIKVCDELGDACRDRLNELGISEDVDARAIRTPLVIAGVGVGLLTASILAVCVFTIPRYRGTPAVEPSVAEIGITDVPPTDIAKIDPFATDMEDTESAADDREESQPLVLADEKANSLSMSVEERDEPEVAAFDPTPWARATLLMVNPAHYAVGMTKPTSDLYEVVAKATEAEAEQAIEYGRSQGLPILGLDPALAREVYARYQPGDRLSTSHSDKVHGFFRPRQFGPAEDNLIAFRDVRNGSWQVGQVSEDNSSFHPLLEPEPQTFKAEYILPGSMRGMSKEELRDWKQIDFVDYCAFQIAKHVSTKDDDRYVAVAIKEVKLDIDPDELNDMRKMDDREWQCKCRTSRMPTSRFVSDCWRRSSVACVIALRARNERRS